MSFIDDVAHLVESDGIQQEGNLCFAPRNIRERLVESTQVSNMTLLFDGFLCNSQAILEKEPVEDDDVQRALFLREIFHRGRKIDGLQPQQGVALSAVCCDSNRDSAASRGR